MKRADLNEIEARANAATKGPWQWDPQRDPYPNGTGEADLPPYIPQGSHLGDTLIGMDDTYEGSDRDAAFIAHARTDVPRLVVEVQFFHDVLRHLGVDPDECDLDATSEDVADRIRRKARKRGR